jgi:CRP/FNR family transcriptional regulator, dissimilatory nitrate respiration regulator
LAIDFFPVHFLSRIPAMPQTIAPHNLKSLPLFAGLADQDKDALIRAGKLRRYAKGENVFLYGDPIRNFHIICEGTVQLFRETPDGHEMTSEVLIDGDAIGETEILQLAPVHQFNALAVKDSVLAEFPAAWLRESAKHNGTLALNVLGMLSRRANIATLEAEHKTTMSAAQQIACFLERLCILHDFDPHGFDLPYNKTLIASRLGMELETFSRGLSKIRDHGISIQGTRVAFDDIEKMESFVCDNCSISGNCSEHGQLRQRLLKRKPVHAN